MNIFGRIMAILAAALVVVGIAFGLAKAGVIQSNMPDRGGFEQQVTSTTAVATTQENSSTTSSDSQISNQAFGPGEGHEREEGGSIFGIGQVLMNFIIVSLIVLPFAVVSKFLNGRKTDSPGGPRQPPLDQATYA